MPRRYDDTHVGHARCYVATDILRRVLTEHFRVPVRFVLGMTDVDDKIVRRANERSVPFGELANDYECAFTADMTSLGVLPPDAVVRVSDHIDEIQEFISKLVHSGLAYANADGSGVYFDTKAFEHQGGAYGKLRPSAVEEDSDGSSHLTSKRNKRDFALWKSQRSDGWDSPWGFGRPGWHIECSAMSQAALGDRLDVHSGGASVLSHSKP